MRGKKSMDHEDAVNELYCRPKRGRCGTLFEKGRICWYERQKRTKVHGKTYLTGCFTALCQSWICWNERLKSVFQLPHHPKCYRGRILMCLTTMAIFDA